ncbi:ketopantoate hydroxymethyltransferase [Bacillus chungangensis]|uniref:Ketopantoate hydroxymethyltransferase n=1 Tax=Bacillus chungangensis TaxID=587633 RepID=A0ABT9WRQ5_9BACI|nr:ketopantoate hydroxymethyltransferase [Bacillus chungangensis]MDQ0175973.1 hypothetical protein [Bacillus chungangensis]
MIDPVYLNEVAEYTKDNINKVVLNKTYDIFDFVIKEVDKTTVKLEYKIPNGLVDAVKSVELRKEDGYAVSINEVYIPISGDTIVGHTIKIKEGIK